MAGNVKPIPEGYHTITPSLICKSSEKAIEFYKKAFGAEELMRIGRPGGGIMHAEIRVGSSRVMLADEMPDMGCKSAQAYGGSPVTFYVYVENVDAAFKRATDAGGKSPMPVMDMFWGDRIGQIEDPFGYKWTIAQHTKDMTPEEMKKGQEAWMAQMQKKRA
jgi:uncharacterized glyoxalase superfamily protein PhnB